MAKAKKPTSGDKAPAETSSTKASAAKTANEVVKPKDDTAAKAAAVTEKASDGAKSSVSEKPAAKAEPVKKADAKATSGTPKVKTTAEKAKAPAAAPKDEAPAKVASSKETPEPKQESKPQVAPAQTTATKQPEKRQSVFWPFVLGGVVAGAIGFMASELNLIGTEQSNDDLRQRVVSQQGQLAKQQEQIEALRSAANTQTEAPDLSGITAELSALQERLSALEARPVSSGSGGDDATAGYAAELAALQASVEAQKSEIQSLLDNAKSVEEATAEMAAQAALRAALAEVTTALSGGAPYEDALAALKAGGIEDIPAALSDTAGSGVVTLTNLQSRFADTARAALSAARASGEQAGEGGLAGFLKRQLGARSVAPREGSDPDAVLSRVGAAVRDGQLSTALDEVDALPEDVQSAMGDWLGDARARAAAEAAAQDLSQRLTAN